YGVNQRTQEIGVRVALGASSSSILRMVFTGGMRPAAIGLVLGLAAAFGVTRVLSALLVGVSPTDPLTFGIVATVLLASAILVCTVPARRAMRVDPAIALRHAYPEASGTRPHPPEPNPNAGNPRPYLA